jgi:hypothetical protein
MGMTRMTEMRRREFVVPQRTGRDLGDRLGGVMRIGRAIIIPAILTLGVAGWSLASTAAPVAAVHMSNVHVVALSTSPDSGIYLHT